MYRIDTIDTYKDKSSSLKPGANGQAMCGPSGCLLATTQSTLCKLELSENWTIGLEFGKKSTKATGGLGCHCFQADE